jgi:hypothetical protein
MNSGAMNTSPQNYLSQINNVQADPNLDSQGVSPLISPNEQSRQNNRMVKNMSSINKNNVAQQNQSYNNSRDGRNYQGDMSGALNGNTAQGNVSRNYGQGHPLKIQAKTTGTKKPIMNNQVQQQNMILQNQATLPQLSISASPSNQQKNLPSSQPRQPNSKVLMSQKRQVDQMSKKHATNPVGDSFMAADKSSNYISSSN